MSRKTYPGGAATSLRFVDAAITRIEARDAQAETRYEIAISSETLVERSFFGLLWREQLDHTPGAVQMDRFQSGRAAFLADHDTSLQIGTLQNARLDSDRVVRADVQWGVSDLAKQRKAEIDAGTGVGTNISVGYVPKRWKLVEESTDQGDLWLATLWEPVEASSVAVPADATVGFGRAGGEVEFYPAEIVEAESVVRSVEVVGDGKTVREGSAMEAVATEVKDPMVRIKALTELAKGFGAQNRLGEWIDAGTTEQDAMRELLAARQTKGEAAGGREAVVDLGAKEARTYSLSRAIEGALSRRGGDDSAFNGLEREVDQEIRKHLPFGVQARDGSVFIPLRMKRSAVEQRALNTVAAGKGSELIFDQAGDLIELLRPRSVCIGNGARVLTGLGAPISFPKMVGGMSFFWLGEIPPAGVTASDIQFGLATLAPKSLLGTTSYSRQLLAIGNQDTEGLVRADFALGMALAVDRTGIHGKGTAGEPIGIYNSAGVNAVAMGGAPTYGKLIDMETQVAIQNADLGTLGWATNPVAAGKFRQTLIASAAGSEMIWSGTMRDGIMAGYRAMASNQISATMSGSADTGGSENGIIFGNWDSMIIGFWAAVELIADPYTLADRAMVKVSGFLMADIMLRHGESFCKSTGAT